MQPHHSLVYVGSRSEEGGAIHLVSRDGYAWAAALVLKAHYEREGQQVHCYSWRGPADIPTVFPSISDEELSDQLPF